MGFPRKSTVPRGARKIQHTRKPGTLWKGMGAEQVNSVQPKPGQAAQSCGSIRAEISTRACDHLVLPLTSYSYFSLTDCIGGTVAGRHSPLLVPSLNMYVRLPFLFSPYFVPPSLFPHSPLSYCYIIQSPETYLAYEIWVHFFPSSF